jgi:hypothetical protein
LIVHYSLSFIVFLVLLGFFLFHTYLVCSGQTTIEFCEKRNSEYAGKSLFKKNCIASLQEALGYNFLLWLFPIKYRAREEDGLYVQAKKEDVNSF